MKTFPGLQTIARRAQRERMNAAHTVDAFDFEAEDVDLDEFFGAATKEASIGRRETDALILRDDSVRVLDELVERHGLTKILATLRSLADSRVSCGSEEFAPLASALDAEENSDNWRAAGDALESLLTSDKVRV